MSILLTQNERSIAAVGEDDGRGFDPDSTGNDVLAFGMRERVALVGGRLRIESKEGADTTIAAQVPVP